MRPILISFAALCAFGVLLAFGILRQGGAGWTSMTPGAEVECHDLDRLAIRQVSQTIADSEGREEVRVLTLLGPTDKVRAPWARFDADFEGGRLELLSGESIPLLPETRVAIWDPATNGWHLSSEPFPEAASLPRLDGGESLAEVLRAAFPAESDRIDRAFPRRDAPR